MLVHVVMDLKKKGLSNGVSLGKHSGKCEIAAEALEELESQICQMYGMLEIKDIGIAYSKCLKSLEEYYKYLIDDRINSQ